MSARRRRWLRWVFAVIFSASAALPVAGREVRFSERKLISPVGGVSQMAFGDIDGDGDLDAAVTSSAGGAVLWIENSDGLGTFGSVHVLSTLVNGALSIELSDLDGDGDLDVLASAFDSDVIVWFENTDGEGSFGGGNAISTDSASPYSVIAADLDGDSDLDVAAAKDDGIVEWFENTDGEGTFGPAAAVTTLADGARSVVAVDIDSDGDLDLVSASALDSKIAWYENTDGLGSFGSEEVVSTLADGAWDLFASDLDRDGDLDLSFVSSNDDTHGWFENIDGAGTFGVRQVISALVQSGRAIIAADLDGDGDADTLTASFDDSKLAWYENVDGAGTFGSQTVLGLEEEAHSLAAVDVDGDGDLDVVAARLDELVWFENETLHRSALFPAPSPVTASIRDPYSLYAADLDGDGDLDVLSIATVDDTIVWSENNDGEGSFGTRQVITTLADAVLSVVAADIDRDGDLDVVSASARDSKLAWYENTDGAGTFGTQQVVTTSADFAYSVQAVDLDGDGDLDLLSGAILDNRVSWYENTDGTGSFGAEQEISTDADTVYTVVSADLDGDGDLDVLTATAGDDTVAWFENTDGEGTFGAEQVISTDVDFATSADASDLDGDGDLDVVSSSLDDNKIAWYENEDGLGTFGPERVVTEGFNTAIVVVPADLDGDGDEDLLTSALFVDRVAWFENVDGVGTFGDERVLSTIVGSGAELVAADLDRDGDLDVLASSSSRDQVLWYENRGGQFSLKTTDVAQGVITNSQEEDLLSIRVTHNGSVGEPPIVLSRLALRFTDAEDVGLTQEDVTGLFVSIGVYLDDGSGVLDEADTEVISSTDFSSIGVNGNGLMTLSLEAVGALAEVSVGTSVDLLVAVTMAEDADQQPISVWRLTHHTEAIGDADPISAAEDDLGIAISLEFSRDVESLDVSTRLDDEACASELDLNLRGVTVEGTLVCTAGTVLDAGSAFHVNTPGDVTFVAGEAVHLSDGFSISGDRLTIQIDPDPDP